ncbi:DUF1842 domain-containing protein [Pseudomonas chlororaphis subsp. piscium]|nr:DUF1842 domain-containing protein [Pseudomonas chlororaphis subsp. piscium]
MQTGLFHTRLHVTTALLGAPVLTLDLLVNTPQKKSAAWPASSRAPIRR